ncbi:hypothetical protein Ancab_015957 [Ancistrocladus abbreviatus]
MALTAGGNNEGGEGIREQQRRLVLVLAKGVRPPSRTPNPGRSQPVAAHCHDFFWTISSTLAFCCGEAGPLPNSKLYEMEKGFSDWVLDGMTDFDRGFGNRVPSYGRGFANRPRCHLPLLQLQYCRHHAW